MIAPNLVSRDNKYRQPAGYQVEANRRVQVQTLWYVAVHQNPPCHIVAIRRVDNKNTSDNLCSYMFCQCKLDCTGS
uniref:Uncharacterized protein n=1 Tax=Triticum urartu TaxID=4572 RepID=A0A8R7PUQ2_TRIUA